MYTTAGLHNQDWELCGQAVHKVPHDPQPQNRPVQKSSRELTVSPRGLGYIGSTALLCPLYFRLWPGEMGGCMVFSILSLRKTERKEMFQLPKRIRHLRSLECFLKPSFVQAFTFFRVIPMCCSPLPPTTTAPQVGITIHI